MPSPRRLEIVELAALLHDVRDWKYSGDTASGARAVRAFCSARAYPSDRADAVVDIISRVGFKDELASATAARRAYRRLAIEALGKPMQRRFGRMFRARARPG